MIGESKRHWQIANLKNKLKPAITVCVKSDLSFLICTWHYSPGADAINISGLLV